MKPHVLCAVLLATVASAASGEMPKGGMKDMPMMQKHLSQMQESLDRIKAARTDAAKMSLMQEHLQLMHDHMKMMGGMCAGGMGGMSSGAAREAPARPAGVSEEEHRAHHPGQ